MLKHMDMMEGPEDHPQLGESEDGGDRTLTTLPKTPFMPDVP